MHIMYFDIHSIILSYYTYSKTPLFLSSLSKFLSGIHWDLFIHAYNVFHSIPTITLSFSAISHWCIYIHVYTCFAQYSPSYSLSLPFPTGTNSPPSILFCPPVLRFCRRKKKKEKKMTFLLL
jgi:hypothetical protein